VEGPLALCNCIEKFLPHLFLQENKETFMDQKLFQKKKDQNKQSIAKNQMHQKLLWEIQRSQHIFFLLSINTKK